MATLRREGPPSQTDGRAVFHCLVESCNWTGNCTRQGAYKHVAEKHPGRKPSLRGQAADKKSVNTRYYQAMKEARQAERKSERLPPEVLMLGTGLVYGLCCDVTPDGTGTRTIVGNLAEGAKDSFQAHCDLHVHVPLWDRPLHTPDIQASLLVALVSLLIGRRAMRDSSAFGEVTAHGFLSSPPKPLTSRDVEVYTQRGTRRLVVSGGISVESEAEREACKLHPRDRKPTLELIRTENKLRVLHL